MISKEINIVFNEKINHKKKILRALNILSTHYVPILLNNFLSNNVSDRIEKNI